MRNGSLGSASLFVVTLAAAPVAGCVASPSASEAELLGPWTESPDLPPLELVDVGPPVLLMPSAPRVSRSGRCPAAG